MIGTARRQWLIAVVAVWGFVLIGLAIWSVEHERPTVAEQRTIEQALPEMQTAAGAVFAAAGGPGRAVELGAVEFDRPCRVTPARNGVSAHRDVTVHVHSPAARAALDAVAASLPPRYAPHVAAGKTRLTFHADAGTFIGIDADALVTAPAVTLRVSTGCRPLQPGTDEADLSWDDPAAAGPPAMLDAVLRALAAPAATGTARTITCPAGGVAGTWTVDGVTPPADLAGRLRFLTTGGGEVRADDEVRAYRAGTDSVVVAAADGRLRVSVSTAC